MIDISILCRHFVSFCMYSYVISVFRVVPFDEDDRDPNVWFLDHNYLENMVAMFKKVNCMFTSESQQAKIHVTERELLHYNNICNLHSMWTRKSQHLLIGNVA